MMKVDSFIKRNCVDGFEILGAATGSAAFVSSCLLKALKIELPENLAYVGDRQCALGNLCSFSLVLQKNSTVCDAFLLRTNQRKPTKIRFGSACNF